MKLKTLLIGAIISLTATFNASAMDDGCNQQVRDPNDTIRKYTIRLPVDYGYQFDIWRLHCDNSEQILVKSSVVNNVEKTTNGVVDDKIKIEQNGKVLSYYTLSRAKTEITTNSPLYELFIYSQEKADSSKRFQVCITPGYDSEYVCKYAFPENQTGMGGTFTVTGTWYDPAYNGSGFNVVEATNGLVMFFYGYKASANGQALWLISDVGPETVKKGQSINLKLYSSTVGNGANFITKPSTGSGISEWGTATVTFDSCASGSITLDGKDGKLTHNIVKLANIKNLTCSE